MPLLVLYAQRLKAASLLTCDESVAEVKEADGPGQGGEQKASAAEYTAAHGYDTAAIPVDEHPGDGTCSIKVDAQKPVQGTGEQGLHTIKDGWW